MLRARRQTGHDWREIHHMDAGRWAIVKSLFEAANAREEPDRTAFLREASAGDASLYREVA